MPLVVGSRLGQYEVVSALGAGGMGEVYRARDTKLGREVALKILPALFAADPDRLARFEREAQVLASLNHPHIAAIYGVEESGGTRALVLELVEGPTLAEKLASGSGLRALGRERTGPEAQSPQPKTGGLPVSEALTIARQIAEMRSRQRTTEHLRPISESWSCPTKSTAMRSWPTNRGSDPRRVS